MDAPLDAPPKSSSPGVGPPAVQEFQTEGKEMSWKFRELLWEPPQMKCCVVLVSQQVTTLV